METINIKECNIEEVPDDDEPPAKSSDDKKENGPDTGEGQGLVFKITSKVPYKTVLKAHSALLLKAESMQEKVEWINKIISVMQPSKGAPGKGMQSSESGPSIRQSLSDGSPMLRHILYLEGVAS